MRRRIRAAMPAWDLPRSSKRMQQRLNAVLLRHGRVGRGGSKWTYAHRVWVDKQVFAKPALAETLARQHRRH
jgi:transposase